MKQTLWEGQALSLSAVGLSAPGVKTRINLQTSADEKGRNTATC